MEMLVGWFAILPVFIGSGSLGLITNAFFEKNCIHDFIAPEGVFHSGCVYLKPYNIRICSMNAFIFSI